jgi:hypothetical protein
MISLNDVIRDGWAEEPLIVAMDLGESCIHFIEGHRAF